MRSLRAQPPRPRSAGDLPFNAAHGVALRGVGASRPLVVAALLLPALGCGPVVVSGGPSAPSGDAVADMDQHIGVVAYEFGACASDRDCAPRGCGGAVCSTNEEPAICDAGIQAQCLASLPTALCGCSEGVCRWERSAPVYQCAQLVSERPSNRPIRPAGRGEMYPIRNGE